MQQISALYTLRVACPKQGKKLYVSLLTCSVLAHRQHWEHRLQRRHRRFWLDGFRRSDRWQRPDRLDWCHGCHGIVGWQWPNGHNWLDGGHRCGSRHCSCAMSTVHGLRSCGISCCSLAKMWSSTNSLKCYSMPLVHTGYSGYTGITGATGEDGQDGATGSTGAACLFLVYGNAFACMYGKGSFADCLYCTC